MSSRGLWSSCRRHTTTSTFRSLYRGLATEAHLETGTSSVSSPPPLNPGPRPRKPPKPAIHTSLILNRSPLLTKTPTTFERAYYAYQSRIQRALHNPFPYDFYFKPGSLLEAKFNIMERFREKRMFGPGFGADAEGAPGRKLTRSKVKKMGQEEDATVLPRWHEADGKGDTKSLDRFGQRNLYLVVKSKGEKGEDVWKFPEGAMQPGELLHESAQREMDEQLGINMDSWLVSRVPIGLYEHSLPTPPTDPHMPTKTCVFFYKAHILAGQVRPKPDLHTDFDWLVKEEIEQRFRPEYWTGVKDMLSDF